MKLCFHHQLFDRDVSSGTEHARHQWHELAMAYGVTEVAVINETDEPFESLAEEITITEYSTLDDFLTDHLSATGGSGKGKNKNQSGGSINIVFVEQGSQSQCRNYPFKSDQWIVIGGAAGLPIDIAGIDYVSLAATTALYPREAAAIALDNALWRM